MKRWEQRFTNFKKAMGKLEEAVKKIKEHYPSDEFGNIDKDPFLDDIIKEGLIQRFEYTHELAWNVMKDYLLYQGDHEVHGSRDAIRESFSVGLITDGEIWMDMIKSRNKTSHTYNENTADEIFNKILEDYFPVFIGFQLKMEEIKDKNQRNISDKS